MRQIITNGRKDAEIFESSILLEGCKMVKLLWKAVW
jgi:hypothetical protein